MAPAPIHVLPWRLRAAQRAPLASEVSARDGFPDGCGYTVDIRQHQTGVDGKRDHFVGDLLGSGDMGIAHARVSAEARVVEDRARVVDTAIDADAAQSPRELVALHTGIGSDSNRVLVVDVLTTGQFPGDDQALDPGQPLGE